ncbi:hypothetical protein PR202_gb16973 [Eleusine coracana subsp. coracana]|uniref:RNase H type-1 domain-containing protein n=1 Tax=Eleusine coracana subsp. coracana TaxID=191504 RepID=A0AAV5F1S5_ELECO|nr:hypothetical protein PR202_gb16973 [Eleusine coracana subsp. coracana]
MSIRRRGMDPDTRCPVCLRLDEDGGHCFLKCKYVKKCWQGMQLEQTRLHLVSLASAKDIVHFILKQEKEMKITILCLLWTWWDTRNKVNAGEPMRSVEEVIHRCRSLIIDCLMLQDKKVQKGANKKENWSPPLSELLKINTDAAFLKEAKTGSWGFVVRNHTGEAVMAGAGPMEGVHNLLCAETEACLTALYAAMANGINSMQLETDYSLLVNGLQTNELDMAPAGSLLREARDTIYSHFVNVEIMFTP